jgi:hypothetical protein
MIEINKIESLGMPMTEIIYKSCIATIGEGKDWATIYSIESKEQDQGHCQELLKQAKEHYLKLGKVFGSTIALNPAMEHILKKLEIPEYD